MSEQTTEQMCDCGHRKSKHYHGRGLCKSIRGSGFICSCKRFKHLREPTPPKPVEAETDPCKMTDVQYEEYIYGPDRAKWPTNQPVEAVPSSEVISSGGEPEGGKTHSSEIETQDLEGVGLPSSHTMLRTMLASEAPQEIEKEAFLGQICVHCDLPWRQHGATTMSCPKGSTKFWPKASTLHLPREPKPAPQADGCWHVCAWDVTLPGSEGMVEVLDEKSQLVCRAKDRATANLIAAQASLLQKIAEFEEKLRNTKKALELACSNDTWTAADYLKAAKGNDDE